MTDTDVAQQIRDQDAESVRGDLVAAREEIGRLRDIALDLSYHADENGRFNLVDLIRHRVAGGDRDCGPLSVLGKKFKAALKEDTS